MPSCRTCKYYVARTALLGECRRHAPSSSDPSPVGPLGRWPLTQPAAWCGDYEDRPAPRPAPVPPDSSAAPVPRGN